MRKVILFILVAVFWGLYHIGKTYPGAGDTIAAVAIIGFVLLILYQLKKYLLTIVLKNN